MPIACFGRLCCYLHECGCYCCSMTSTPNRVVPRTPMISPHNFGRFHLVRMRIHHSNTRKDSVSPDTKIHERPRILRKKSTIPFGLNGCSVSDESLGSTRSRVIVSCPSHIFKVESEFQVHNYCILCAGTRTKNSSSCR
jgi:hypothetical protein